MNINCKKIAISAALVAAVVTTCGFDHKGELVEDIYTVKQGDTLWSIASNYMDKNTYGPRNIREFMSGIVELNYDRIFKGREPALIYPGDELRINYWTAEDRRGDDVDSK